MTLEHFIAGGAARLFHWRPIPRRLKDGREVYINGERVKDVTTHPAVRNAVRSLSRLYDALHDLARKEMP